MKDNKIVYVSEIYMDEKRTLQQGIMYKYDDDMEREYLRGTINPHLTELVFTMHFNKDMELIKEEK